MKTPFAPFLHLICTVLAAALLLVLSASADDLAVRVIDRSPDVRNLDTTDTLKWYADESIDYTVRPRRGKEAVSIPGDAVATWIIADPATGTNYLSAVAASQTSNSVTFHLPLGGAALPESVDEWVSFVSLLQGTNFLGVIDRTRAECLWSPYTSAAALVPTNPLPELLRQFATTSYVAAALAPIEHDIQGIAGDLAHQAEDIAAANAAAMPRAATRSSGGGGLDPPTNSVTDFLWASNGVVSVRAANIQSLTDADGNDAYVSCMGGNLFSGGLFRPVVKTSGTLYVPGPLGVVTQGCTICSTSVLWRTSPLICTATNYPEETDTNLFSFVPGRHTSFSSGYLDSIRKSSLVTNLLHVDADATADDLITVGLAYAGVTNYAAVRYSSMTSAGDYALDISFVPGSFRAHNRQLMYAAVSNAVVAHKTEKHYYSSTNVNPNHLFSGVLDTTCYSDMGATQAYSRTCTLITPQHCACVGHWVPPVGTTMTWFDASGGRHTASVAAVTNLSSRLGSSPDAALAICRLSNPVLGPNPARILSTNALRKLAGWTNSIVQAYNTCYITGTTNRFDCDYKVEGLSTLTLTSTGIRTTRAAIPDPAKSSIAVSPDTLYPDHPGWSGEYPYGEYLATRFLGDSNNPFVGGNSGSPTLLHVAPDAPPILLSVMNSADGAGPNVCAYGPYLQDAIDAIGNPNHYQIIFEDLAAWSSYAYE